MKKILLTLLVLGGALAAIPAARADSFNFVYSAPGGVSGSGTLVGNYLGPDVTYGTSDWLITSGTGTFDDGTQTGAITLIANPNSDGTPGDPVDGLSYDDILLVPAADGFEWLDYNGLLFSFEGGVVNFWDGDFPYVEAWNESNGPSGNGPSGNGAFTITPEPGSLLLMGTGLFGLALLLLKRRRSALALTASSTASLIS